MCRVISDIPLGSADNFIATSNDFYALLDRTAKIWNLVTGQEFETLNGHPNNVNVRLCSSYRISYNIPWFVFNLYQVVHRCPISGLVYTVSLCYIKVWDIRTKAKCVKVLRCGVILHWIIRVGAISWLVLFHSSSGQILSPSSFLATMGRTNRMPDNEWQISDLALSRDSKLLYTAAGNTVKIWDLNK